MKKIPIYTALNSSGETVKGYPVVHPLGKVFILHYASLSPMWTETDIATVKPCEVQTTMNEYQRLAAEFDEVQGRRLMYAALGLNEEAGEVAGKIKKAWRDNEGIITEQARRDIIHELGDVLWYVAMAAREVGAELETIAKENIAKLESRRERGTIAGQGDDR